MNWGAFYPLLFAVIIAAGLSWGGQYGFSRRSEKREKREMLLNHMFKISDLLKEHSISYWSQNADDSAGMQITSAQILANLLVLSKFVEEFDASGQKPISGKFRLMHKAMTGGDFEQSDHRADPERVRKIANRIADFLREVIKAFPV